MKILNQHSFLAVIICSLLISLSAKSIVYGQLSITKLSSDNGTPGNSIFIYGAGFDATNSDNTVTFNSFRDDSSTTGVVSTGSTHFLEVTVPSGLKGGNYSISVERASDNSTIIAPGVFFVTTSGGFFDSGSSANGFDLEYPNLRNHETGDMDGDGDIDLLFVSCDFNQSGTQCGDYEVAWYENNNDTYLTFTEHVIIQSQSEGFTDLYLNDLDSDGDLDIVGLNSNVYWFENNGATTPTFTKQELIDPTEGVGNNMLIGDLDSDGDQDIVLNALSADSVFWYENNGASTPSFSEHTLSEPAPYSDVQFIGDITGDGHLDIAMRSIIQPADPDNLNEITWYENSGASNPTFSKHSINTISSAYNDLFATDINLDGHLDIIVPGRVFDFNLSLLLNDGNSTPSFTESVIYNEDEYTPSILFSGDLDGDGDIDLGTSMTSRRSNFWFENNGDESFTKKTLSADANSPIIRGFVDLDDDGDLDLVASSTGNSIYWHLNHRTPQIAGVQTPNGIPGTTATMYGSELAPLSVSVSIGLIPVTGGTTTTATPIVSTDSILTFNIPDNLPGGNYRLSVTRSGDDTTVTSPAIFSVSTGGGGFGSVGSSKHVVSTTPDRPFSVFGEDIDGDGDVDLLSASSLDDKVIWYENDGNQSFSENTITEDLDDPAQAKVFDIDGDGDMDLIAASNDNASIIWYESDGASDPSFTSHIVNNISSGASGIHAADVDGDGDLDLISVAFDDDELAWHENDNGFGSVNSSTHVISTDVDGARQVYADDIDGDGDIDLMTASLSDNTIAWYENDGGSDPSFTKIVINSSMSGPRSVYSGDVDGDGDIDIMSASVNNNTIAWFENDGTADPGFTKHTIATNASIAYSVFAGDVDADGDLDIFSASLGNNSVTWYENDGASDPSFTKRVITNDASGATSAYAIDVDGDGDLDVISSSGNDDTIAWYENTASFSTPGQALTLDGTNDFISVPGVASHLGADPDFTFEAWVKPDMDNQAEGTGILFARNSSTALNVLLIGIENTASSDSKQLRVFDQNSGDWEISGTQLTNNQWHHVAYTLSSGTGTLFLDGTQIGQHTLDINLSINDTLSIGQEFDSGFTTGNFLLADVDEIRFWDVALTEVQIQQNMFQQLDGSEANLVSYWSLDEETGFEAKDGTENEYDGTMYGSPARSSDTHPYGTFVTGNEGWRMFTSPFGNASYGTLLDTFWTQGFTGADHAGGTSNVYTWDESTQTFVSINNATDIPAQGTGFIVYVYDDVDNDETADGFPKMIKTDSTQNSGSMNPTLSYTDTGNSSDDGWNLVGNPYGATIDWDAATGLTSSNIDASFYVWSDSAGGGAGAYLSWNGTTGTFGGGEIAPWQGFWVKANAADPSVSLNDEVRSAGGVLRKKAPVQELRFTLTGGELSSKAIVMFSDKASKEKDVFDAYKLQSLNTDFLSLFTQLDNGAALDINALPLNLDGALEVGLGFELQAEIIPEEFELYWNLKSLSEEWNLTLIDNHTGEEFNLREAKHYSFGMEANSKVIRNRSEKPTQKPLHPEHKVLKPDVLKAKNSGSRFTLVLNASTPVSNEPGTDLPTVVELKQNYPNPFNPSTTIAYGVPKTGKVTLEVFDLLGRKVATLLNRENKATGRYSVQFNASNLASGMYIYRLKAGNIVMTKKLTLIK